MANEWNRHSKLSTKRHDFHCEANDGSIYVVGGFNHDHAFSTTERHDPESATWSQATSEMPRPRGLFASGSYGDRIYIAGGKRIRKQSLQSGSGPRYRVFRTVDSYDVVNDRWTRLPGLDEPRAGLAGTVHDGVLFAAGGWVQVDPVTALTDDTITDRIDLFDIGRRSWNVNEGPLRLPEPLLSPRLVSVEGEVFLLGGYNGQHYVNDVYRLTDDNSWELWDTMLVPRRDFALSSDGSDIYLAAGITNADDPAEEFEYVRACSKCEPFEKRWTELPPYPTGMAWCDSTVVDNSLYVCGGAYHDRGTVVFSDEVFTLPIG